MPIMEHLAQPCDGPIVADVQPGSGPRPRGSPGTDRDPILQTVSRDGAPVKHLASPKEPRSDRASMEAALRLDGPHPKCEVRSAVWARGPQLTGGNDVFTRG